MRPRPAGSCGAGTRGLRLRCGLAGCAVSCGLSGGGCWRASACGDEAVTKGEIDARWKTSPPSARPGHHHARAPSAAPPSRQPIRPKTEPTPRNTASQAKPKIRKRAEVAQAGHDAEEQALDRRDAMPVHQRRRMPEHQEQRWVQQPAASRRGSSCRCSPSPAAGVRRPRAATPAPVTASEPHGVDHAQQQHGPHPLAPGAEGADQHGGHRKAALGRFRGRRHQAQRGGRHQHAAEDARRPPALRSTRITAAMYMKNSPASASGCLQEGLDAELDPLDAGARGNDVEFHWQYEGRVALDADSLRETRPRSGAA